MQQAGAGRTCLLAHSKRHRRNHRSCMRDGGGMGAVIFERVHERAVAKRCRRSRAPGPRSQAPSICRLFRTRSPSDCQRPIARQRRRGEADAQLIEKVGLGKRDHVGRDVIEADAQALALRPRAPGQADWARPCDGCRPLIGVAPLALRRGPSDEMLVEIRPAITPPGQALLRRRDLIEVELLHQELRAHRRLQRPSRTRQRD